MWKRDQGLLPLSVQALRVFRFAWLISPSHSYQTCLGQRFCFLFFGVFFFSVGVVWAGAVPEEKER